MRATFCCQGAARASLRATGHVQGWVLEHLPSSKIGCTYIADAATDKAIDAGEPASNGVIEVPAPLRRLQPALDNRHPAGKLLVLGGEQHGGAPGVRGVSRTGGVFLPLSR